MILIRIILFVCIGLGLAQADEKNAVNLTLTSFLDSLRKGESDKVYFLQSEKTKQIMLDNAFVRLSYTSQGEGPQAQAAKNILLLHFNKEKAEIELQKSKLPLSQLEKELLLLRHISHPEILCLKWRNLEEKYNPEPNRAWRESVAKANDFSIIIEGDMATANGIKNKNLKVQFIKEQEKWGVVGDWIVELDADTGVQLK